MSDQVIVALISGASGVLIAGIVNQGWFKKKKKKDPVKSAHNSAVQINTVLDQVKDDLKADRVGLLQFHNGQTFHTGSHFQKMSCTHERVSEGTERTYASFQDIPVTAFSWWFDQVVKGAFIYRDVEDITDYATKSSFKASGVVSTVSIPVEKNGNIVAVVTASWVKSTMDEACLACDVEDSKLVISLSENLAGISKFL